MEEKEIIQLFLAKDENAITNLDKQYRKYLYKIAYNILNNSDDCDECLNDVYIAAWKNIPLARPYNLKMYLARITKNTALKMVEYSTSQKRGGGQYALALDEIENVVGNTGNPEKELFKKITRNQIKEFLYSLNELDMKIFVRRYWFFDGCPDIARLYGISSINVKVRLHRIRNKLKEYLLSLNN